MAKMTSTETLSPRRPVVGGLTRVPSNDIEPPLEADSTRNLRFVTCPLLLGRGKRLFGDDAHASAFTLAHSISTPGGVLITRYVRSGEVRTGTWGVE
jgi:hypothetical protein